MRKATLLKMALIAGAMIIGISSTFATIVSHTFSATSGSIDSNISFTTEKNSASTAPAFNVNLRLYYAASGDGGSITLTPSNGAVISQVKITGVTSYLPTVKYNVDGGADASATLSTLTYTISGITASTSLKIRNGNTINTQLRITAIEVTYSSCTASNLAFTSSAVSKTLGAANFTQTATSLSSGAITYSSSATNVASVNINTGEVSVIGSGSTTITATQAELTPYCGNTATYTLNVTAAPTLTVTDVTNPVLVSNDGNQVSQIINVSGVNLTTDLGLTISGPNADLFTLSKYSVSQTGGNVPNTEITITYKPVTGTNHSATLTMASTGAFDLARPISGVNNGTTEVNSVLSSLNVYAYNGKININANAGESLDIYNSVGQRIMHTITAEGLNSISVPARGVLLVKLGNKLSKVIL